LKQGADAGGYLLQGGISQATYFNWKKKYDGLLLTGDAAAEAARG
jgi:hypothetical protein